MSSNRFFFFTIGLHVIFKYLCLRLLLDVVRFPSSRDDSADVALHFTWTQFLGTPVNLPKMMTLAASEGEPENLYLLKVLVFCFFRLLTGAVCLRCFCFIGCSWAHLFVAVIAEACIAL